MGRVHAPAQRPGPPAWRAHAERRADASEHPQLTRTHTQRHWTPEGAVLDDTDRLIIVKVGKDEGEAWKRGGPLIADLDSALERYPHRLARLDGSIQANIASFVNENAVDMVVMGERGWLCVCARVVGARAAVAAGRCSSVATQAPRAWGRQRVAGAPIARWADPPPPWDHPTGEHFPQSAPLKLTSVTEYVKNATPCAFVIVRGAAVRKPSMRIHSQVGPAPGEGDAERDASPQRGAAAGPARTTRRVAIAYTSFPVGKALLEFARSKVLDADDLIYICHATSQSNNVVSWGGWLEGWVASGATAAPGAGGGACGRAPARHPHPCARTLTHPTTPLHAAAHRRWCRVPRSLRGR